jgi:transcriptional regulator with XRE-family HTH domain
MSQDDLSALSGLAQSYISLLERGNRMPGLDSFFRIARALKIKPTTLLAEIEKSM